MIERARLLYKRKYLLKLGGRRVGFDTADIDSTCTSLYKPKSPCKPEGRLHLLFNKNRLFGDCVDGDGDLLLGVLKIISRMRYYHLQSGSTLS